MARAGGDARRSRFARSGHTRHQPRVDPGAPAVPSASPYASPPGHTAPPPGYAAPPPGPTGPPPGHAAPPNHAAAPPGYPAPPPGYAPSPYVPPADDVTRRYPDPRDHVPAAARAATTGFGEPTYHAGAPRGPGGPGGAAGAAGVTAPAQGRPAVRRTKAATRAALSGTNRAARTVTTRVIAASRSDGAQESGLTALIWNQVLSYGTDAMITVALAGTVFFGASTHAQRGNVLLYLLITMAPFAVVAPVIGPVLDRFQHGRRWTMAATAIGRAILALVMASHPSELLVLYPCALGSLVLSKAYSVLRAAAAPRLVPPGMTLTEANARLTIFGLGSTLVLGGAVGVVIKVTGSYSVGLWLTAIGFAVCAWFAFRLPRQVDSSTSAPRHPQEQPRPTRQPKAPPLTRLRGWASRGFEAHVIIALQGESALRLLSGLLTIYLAFYVESTAHGLDAALQLGAVVGAAGLGNFSGTGLGTKLRMARPEAVVVAAVGIAGAICVVTALAFSVLFAVIAMYVGAVANALAKIALDALIQRDVPETLRSSAFARSETFLQLAWVLGAAVGVLLPSDRAAGGAIGFWIAALLVGGTAVVVLLRLRVMTRATPDLGGPRGPGSVPPGGRPPTTVA